MFSQAIWMDSFVAEVEFESEEESSSFEPPSWFSKEITHDERYKNKNLALNGMP